MSPTVCTPRYLQPTATAIAHPGGIQPCTGRSLLSPPHSATTTKPSYECERRPEFLKSKGERRQQSPSLLERYRAELRAVAEKCKVLSQFADQYGPDKNKFNAQPSDDLVIDMARKAYEVLMVFMTIRRERMSTSVDDDTMEYIRKRRTVLSPTRTKARKRSVNYAKLNKRRACETGRHSAGSSGSVAPADLPASVDSAPPLSAAPYHGDHIAGNLPPSHPAAPAALTIPPPLPPHHHHHMVSQSAPYSQMHHPHQQQHPASAHVYGAAHYSAPNTATYPPPPSSHHQTPDMPRSASWHTQQQPGYYHHHPQQQQQQQSAFCDQRESSYAEYRRPAMQISGASHLHGTHKSQSQQQQQQPSQRHATSSISKILG
ncbi:hypothetical protein GGI19_002931 [Coemansia pectinata]|uniref:Uncharacterized protein n=1 Tax=Coemansia pectinata TaxID=1052879 RepID=A0A9W8LBF6_9FUNG|nr:hypothetical protein GGI19_002931 [Coemansia pectinata]